MSLVGLLVVVNGLMGFVVVAIVLNTQPEHLRRLAEQNATRLDGTWSPRRASREAKDVCNFVANVLFGSAPLFILTNGFILFVHSLIPVPLAVDAVALIAPQPSAWKQRLEDNMIGERQIQSYTQDGGTDEAARDWQHLLWNFWPLALLAGVVLLIVGFRILTKVYLASLRELERNIQLRRTEYLWHDLAVMDAQATSPPDAPPSDWSS